MNGIARTMVFSIVFLTGGAAMAADICTASGSVVTCDNGTDGTYSEWKVGKLTTGDTIVACAKISGAWVRVGIQNLPDPGSYTQLEVKGDTLPETIRIVDTSGSESCDDALSLWVTRLPSAWFTRIYVYGYSSVDTITGSYRDEYIYGGTYGDTIDGRGGNDRIYGESGGDTISGGTGNDTISGGDGNDTINGNSGIDSIDGGANDDTVYGGSGDDDLSGGTGDDYIDGEDGYDWVWGGADTDHLYGGEEDDELYGGTGRDWLYGEGGADLLVGGDEGAYDDTYIDMLYGGDNNDSLLEDAGACYGEAHDLPVPPGDCCDCSSETGCETSGC